MAAGELTTDLVAAEGAVDYRDDVRLIGRASCRERV